MTIQKKLNDLKEKVRLADLGGGKERTLAEFESLFAASSFDLNRIIDAEENDRILECTPKFL